MRGLAGADDHTFVAGMRAINRGVLNPAFLTPIFLSPIALIGAGIACSVVAGSVNIGAGLIFIAAGLSLFGGVVLTATINVPLNNALDRDDRDDSAARLAFETRWMASNRARAVLTFTAFVVATLGALVS